VQDHPRNSQVSCRTLSGAVNVHCSPTNGTRSEHPPDVHGWRESPSSTRTAVRKAKCRSSLSSARLDPAGSYERLSRTLTRISPAAACRTVPPRRRSRRPG
jgi:hypothetical protein